MVKVRRHTNAYGYSTLSSNKSCQFTIRVGTPSESVSTKTATVPAARSYRETPKPGVIIRGFRKPTPWFMLADRMDSRHADYTYRNPSLGYYGTYKYVGDSDAYLCPISWNPQPWSTTSKTVSIPPSLTSRTNLAALNGIKNQNVNLGVAFAEANKTLALLANSVSALYRVYRAARRGNWREVTYQLKKHGYSVDKRDWHTTAAGTWLQYVYGWLPLMSDIYGLQEQLKEGFRSKGYLFKSESQASTEMPNADCYTKAGGYSKWTVANRSFYISRTVYYCKIDDAQLYALNQLGLVNPLEIAWELVPFSFVIDWIIPLGAFLSSLTASLGTAFVAGFEDRIASIDVEAEGYTYTFIEGTKQHVSRKAYAFERRTRASFTPPRLIGGSGFNTRRAISAVALFAQRMR